MWIRLLKSHKIAAKTFPIGRVMKLTLEYAKKLIETGVGEEYKGELPPSKMKTDLFKPKQN